jgi:hypothetical protein
VGVRAAARVGVRAAARVGKGQRGEWAGGEGRGRAARRVGAAARVGNRGQVGETH